MFIFWYVVMLVANANGIMVPPLVAVILTLAALVEFGFYTLIIIAGVIGWLVN